MTVSVVMITYGHEEFIGQAIESILMQECDFPVELIISNDNSPDGTDQIVKDFISNHPRGSWIRYFCHAENKGGIKNFFWTIKQTKGDFVAVCEGDDYWTDREKLARQVSFLRAHKEYSICFHRVHELIDDSRFEVSYLNRSDTEATFSIEDLAVDNLINTPSVVFRKHLANDVPRWIEQSPVGDYVLHMLNARNGLIKYFPESMAVYRKHAGGIWSTLSRKANLEKWRIVLNFLLDEPFSEIVKNNLLQQRRKYDTEYLLLLLEQDDKMFYDKLQAFSADDLVFSQDWLLNVYPAYIKQLKNEIDKIRASNTYRLSRKIAQLKDFTTLTR